jgi:mono/diheme cytochrome c family protein
MNKRSLAAIILAIFLAALLGFLLSAQVRAGDDTEYITKGRKLFMQYCATCHGETAKGSGPVAQALKSGAPDLTVLQPAGEKFPFYRVQTAIDGEKAVTAHGTRKMPVWGTILRKTDGALQKEADIYALVKYIESIQTANK